MILRTFGTGSKGNAYALIAKDKVLLIECGLPFMEVARGLNYQVSNIVGVVVSHDHG